jgi:hypothetical protein
VGWQTDVVHALRIRGPQTRALSAWREHTSIAVWHTRDKSKYAGRTTGTKECAYQREGRPRACLPSQPVSQLRAKLLAPRLVRHTRVHAALLGAPRPCGSYPPCCPSTQRTTDNTQGDSRATYVCVCVRERGAARKQSGATLLTRPGSIPLNCASSVSRCSLASTSQCANTCSCVLSRVRACATRV